MKRLKITVTMAILFNSVLLFAQTESNSQAAASELAQFNPSGTNNQNPSKPETKMEAKEETVETEIIIETKLLPIKDMLVVDLPENSTSIYVMQRNGKLVNEILCNPEDKKITMDFSYLPKGNYSLQFKSNSKIQHVLNFKKGRVRYQ